MIDIALLAVGVLVFAVAILMVLAWLTPRRLSRLFPRLFGNGRTRLKVALVFGVPLLALLALFVALAAIPQYRLDYDEAAAIVCGEATELTVWVTNEGLRAGTFSAAYSLDGTPQTDVSVPVQRRQMVRLGLPIPSTISPGPHTALVGDVKIEFTARTPAIFIVDSLEADRPVAKIGQVVTVTAEVANTGETVGDFEAKLEAGGKVLATQLVSIAPGREERVVLTFKGEREQQHELRLGGKKTDVVVVKPVRWPNGHFLTRKTSKGKGRLTVRNGNTADGVVVLTRASAPRKPVIAAYVRSGKSFTVRGIPDGRYRIYYMVGHDWNAHQDGFLVTTRRGRFTETATFKTTTRTTTENGRRYTTTRSTTYRVTLRTAEGGTGGTTRVPDDEFPHGR